MILKSKPLAPVEPFFQFGVGNDAHGGAARLLVAAGNRL
jgi:hypothetical protein